MTTKTKTKTANRTRDVARVATGRALAKLLGRSESRIARLRRGGTWPEDVPRNGPWSFSHVATLKTWLGERRGSGVLSAADLEGLNRRQREELRLIIERRLRLAVQRRILERDLVDRREVERGRIERIVEMRRVLLGLPRELSAELLGRTEREEVERILGAGIERALRTFAGEDWPPSPADEATYAGDE